MTDAPDPYLAIIEPSYTDIWGNIHEVPHSTIEHILGSLKRQSTLPVSPLPPVKIIPAERRTLLHLQDSGTWKAISEDGSEHSGEISAHTITLPPLSMGYWDLCVTGKETYHCRLIAAPPKCWMPAELTHGKRIWGIAAQLYSLRSQKNWGMGDLSDLQVLVKNASALGADVVGLNPLHALFSANPQHFSPYSPSNRMYLNSAYIDVTAVEGFKSSVWAQSLWSDPEFQANLSHARAAELIDYGLVAKLKQPVLRALYEEWAASAPSETYMQFVAEGAEGLRHQAIFDALCDYFYQEYSAFRPWWQWPDSFHAPNSEAVQNFARTHEKEVNFYCWLQWQGDMQLAVVQHTALSSGMQVGLYRDLAVGSDKAGAEVWVDPKRFIANVSVGAPPDEYNPKGQNWGLPPFNPFNLRAQAYAPFIQLLRANMRHARALRIDHAFGLARLFLIPDGKDASEGAYIRYPFEEMLAVLRLESHLQQCMVIGEDLGTPPPGYKETAEQSGLLSYKLLYFEHEKDGSFTPPERYPAQALAMLSTHDLPTLEGWLARADIDEREKLELYPSTELIARDRAGRQKDQALLAQALVQEKLGNTITIEPVQRYLCRTPSAIVMLQLEDVLGQTLQANLPTTTTERPNWRMKLSQTLETIVKKNGTLAGLARAMNEERAKQPVCIPRATYRLQFHKGFTFYDAAQIMPYLVKLGISHVYASPYLQARPGSMHGYDITDHNALNPELGGEEGYRVYLAALEKAGLKQILDFVPNHMGVGGSDNHWWLSVLEWGRRSPYAAYFDIDWSPRYPSTESKLIVPFLGDHYGTVLDKGELALRFDETEGSFSVWYANHRFPICPCDYGQIDASLPDVQTPEQGETCKAALDANKASHAHLHEVAQTLSTNHEVLHRLLQKQHYRLAYWRVASSDINYRRFFDISDLAGVRPEVPAMFDAMHARVLSLIREGKLHGLRIDHIDGLADPAGYCRRLRAQAGSMLYLTVEKILGAHETLPENWPIQGTSGYDALNLIGNVFVDEKMERAFTRIYQRFSGMTESLEAMIYEAKLSILDTTLASELHALSLVLKRIMEESPYTRDYTLATLSQSLREIIGWFPVYRSYVTPEGVSDSDIKIVEWAVGRAKKRSAFPDIAVYDRIEALLLMQEPLRGEMAAFTRKFQQLSGPVMAKGVEDTSFYRYNRLLSLNEVGGEPARFGLPLKAFNAANKRRAEHLPHSMLATATHDTKRGEDFRMRLNALPEFAQAWGRALHRWPLINRTRYVQTEELQIPSRNEEYFIYQTLLGSWPNELMQLPLDGEVLTSYLQRLDAYLIKALREAKVHSGWANPDEAYEASVLKFVHAILEPSAHNIFFEDFLPLARKLALAGAVSSLGQTVLKCTLPGVPDIYQGTEKWDLSFVDPDNRRRVNYEEHAKMLAEVETLPQLLSHWQDSKVKQHLIRTLLTHRAMHEELYRYGSYKPLAAKGLCVQQVLAFARNYKHETLIIVLPLCIARELQDTLLPAADFWADTSVSLPVKGKYRNLLTEEQFMGPVLHLSEAFKIFPAAVLVLLE